MARLTYNTTAFYLLIC